MTNFRLQKILGILVSISLISQPIQAAYTPVAATSIDNNAAAATSSDDLGASSSESAATLKSTTITTGSLPLPKSSISMDFQDADVRDVMHLMAVKSGINIIYGADVTGPVTIHLDHVPFDQAFQTVLTLKGLVALPIGDQLIRVVSSTGLTTEQSQAATFTKVFVLKYGDAQTIKVPLDAIRAAAGRKGVSTVDAKTNSLIITDTLEGLKEVEDLIPALDRKPQEVDIEAKIVEVDLDNDTKVGISWAFAKGQNGSNENQYGQTIQPTGTSPTGVNALPQTTVSGPGSAASPNFGTGVTLADPAALAQSAFSFLHQEQAFMLQAQLTALASKNKVKILSTPHVVTLNNTDASIDVVDQIPYQVSTVSQGIASNSVQFVEAGVKLTVHPTVNADRRITLKVSPEVSNAVNAAAAFQGAPPAINTRKAQTTVLLRDGETIAIGGLITENNTKTVTGIPILMSIPILGWLFKSKEDRIQRTELIVFLTPRIAGE